MPWTPRTVDAGRLDVGRDEDGQATSIRLYGRSRLGGITGAGKSSILQGVIAAVAATPGWRLSICDPKRVELAAWRRHADAYACEADDALDLLDGVLDDMAARYRHMADRGLRTADPDDPATPPSVVVVDELASYTGDSDRKVAKQFERRLRELASLGRAAGISLVLATQKPSSDTVPTSIRDVIPTRWALACTSPHHSDAILGAGVATAGHDASRLNRGLPGVGFLLDENSTPRLVRAAYLDDPTLARLTSGTGRR